MYIQNDVRETGNCILTDATPINVQIDLYINQDVLSHYYLYTNILICMYVCVNNYNVGYLKCIRYIFRLLKANSL